MRSVRFVALIVALCGASPALAEEPAQEPAAPRLGVAGDFTQSASPAASASQAAPASPQPAPTTVAPVPNAAPAPNPSPEAGPVPAAAPMAPAAAAQPAAQVVSPTFVYQAVPPPRALVLVPRGRTPRPRPKRLFGDAGAPFALAAGVGFGWPSDAGYRVAGIGSRHNRVELFGAYDVWQPVKKLVLSVGGSFRTLTGGDGSVATIDERAIQADVLARYTLCPWLFPHLRASFGAVGTKLRMEDPRSYSSADSDLQVTYEDKDWAPVGTLGGGFTLRTKARTFETWGGHMSSLSLGVLVEGGYSFAPTAKLGLHPSASPAPGIDVRTAAPGSLDRSGPYVRVAGVVRF